MLGQTVSLIAVVVVCCLLPQSGHSSDVRIPPTIVKEPIHRKYYRSDDEVTLVCEATGVPAPTYEWFKNGAPLGNRENIYRGEGRMEIRPLTSLDEGYYQCHAVSMYGTAVSNTTVLRRADIGSYQSSIPRVVTKPAGSYYKMTCEPVKCFPEPSYSWALAEIDRLEETPTRVVTNNRVQIDEEGNLHFASLSTDDAQTNKVYKCNVLNPYLDLTIGGSYTRLHVTSTQPVKNFGPLLAFSSPASVVAVEGRDVSLRCFFSGYPVPIVKWSRSDGKRMPIGRYAYLHDYTELKIRNVEKADEGDYKCETNTMSGSDSFVMQIDVQWEPKFQSPADEPHSVNITEGDELRIPCRVTAEPVADIVWLRDGERLDPLNMPSRMRLSNNELILTDACKNCDDRISDLQVIQCNASNVHGYQFVDAYINVLQRTKMTDKPESVHLAYDETFAEFYCTATGDDSTPVTIRWYRISSRIPVVNSTGRVNVTVSQDGTTLSFDVVANDTEGWAMLTGKYQAVATNGYSSEVADFNVAIDPPPIPLIPDGTTPSTGAVIGGDIRDLWWLLLIFAILLLILIIIICCCVCCKRCKGDTYYVDKKEQQDHKDPVKELADSALQPYRRPDTDALNPSALGDSMKGDSDEDEESLNEYGDIDAGKFTEDGSFIGDYHSEQRNRGRPTDSYA